MSETKHTATPGPWRAGQFTDGETWEVIDADKDPVCGCFKIGKRNHEANSRLIATAPELLDALEGAITLLDLLRTGSNRKKQEVKYATVESRHGSMVNVDSAIAEFRHLVAKAKGAA